MIFETPVIPNENIVESEDWKYVSVDFAQIW